MNTIHNSNNKSISKLNEAESWFVEREKSLRRQAEFKIEVIILQYILI